MNSIIIMGGQITGYMIDATGTKTPVTIYLGSAEQPMANGTFLANGTANA